MGKRISGILAAVLGTFLLLAAPCSFATAEKDPAGLSLKTVRLQLALRDAWTDHIFWVRNVVLMTKLGENEGAKVAEDMAVKNAHDLADSIIPYYGKGAADKFFNLLAAHYDAIKDYMIATYTRDAAAQKAAAGKIKSNADQTAAFLSSANPQNWPKEILIGLLTTHGTYHMMQINAINEKNFTSDARTWADMKKNVFAIADALAAGIVKQFPAKF